jgi:hypothetical protein
MAANYVLLETITVGEAGASSVTFNNIPQSGYTDLKIVMSARSSYSASNTVDTLDVQFNGITSGYTAKDLYTFSSGSPGSGSYTTQSAGGTTMGRISDSSVTVSASGITANTFNNAELYIPNYTSSNAKSYSFEAVSENNSSSYTSLTLAAGLWSYTGQPAITKVTFGVANGNFAQYSTFSLYGLAAVGTTPVIAPYASGGDIIQTDGTYWIHTFLSSGTFTPAKGLSCQYLVIAGGGGAGYSSGGGGGAGGYRSSVVGESSGGGSSAESVLSLAANTGYTVSIGAGGAGSTTTATGTNGTDSIFSTITSTGGGGGGSRGTSANGLTGGAGGGSSSPSATPGSGTVGAGTANQGYSGGAGSTDAATYATGGGGGGAGSAGGLGGISSANNVGGNGGNGVSSSITGSAVSRAGGGGGGGNSGGGTATAGGGTGGSSGTAGTANTGGGGGASGGGASGTKGGSGIVIVRYAI